jgi:hypothetical protein
MLGHADRPNISRLNSPRLTFNFSSAQVFMRLSKNSVCCLRQSSSNHDMALVGVVIAINKTIRIALVIVGLPNQAMPNPKSIML